MTTESKDEAGGMDPRDDEALWNLLGRQEPPVKASPYFVRRVLRDVAETPRGGWASRFRGFWTLAPRYTAAWSGAFALAVLCLSAVLTIPANHPPMVRPAAVTTDAADFPPLANVVLPAAPEALAPLEEAAPVQDVELITDLDDLLNREESRLWTEDDTARF